MITKEQVAVHRTPVDVACIVVNQIRPLNSACYALSASSNQVKHQTKRITERRDSL